MSHTVGVRECSSAQALTVEQHHGLLERQRVPDLQLAVGALEDAGRQEEHEGRRLLDALEHALLRQVVGAVVVPRLEAAHRELEVDGVRLLIKIQVHAAKHDKWYGAGKLCALGFAHLVAARGLRMAVERE